MAREPGASFRNNVSRIDLTTGAVSDLFNFVPADLGLSPSSNLSLEGISIDPSNPAVATILATSLIEGFLFDLDLNTGVISGRVLLSIPIATDLARASDGTFYVSSAASFRRIGRIDRATGVVTQTGSCTSCTMRAMNFDPSGALFEIDAAGVLARISTTAQTLQTLGPTGLGFVPPGAAVFGMAFVVPEPSTALLLALGLAALAIRRRAS